MQDTQITNITQVESITQLKELFSFTATSKQEMYAWLNDMLGRLRYFGRSTRKKERGIILTFLAMMTGCSRSRVKALTGRKKRTGMILRKTHTRNSFAAVYTPEDVALLIELDNAHSRRSGKATKALILRAYTIYNDVRYERLRHISVSHLYNLRGRRQYLSWALTWTKTNPNKIPIGIRKKPEHGGKPGCIRVDSVHQGDRDKEKGVYHINLVDEVTQWELIGCVEGISEYFLLPLLEELLLLFPFRIWNFHSDNGSEYVNYQVAAMLTKLMVEQTKSRARHSNDNALVEGKNGAVIRKHMGYVYIPKKHARMINAFYRAHMDDYLNFHRPSAFATLKIDRRGKETKRYDIYLTPFAKLQTIPNVEDYLRPGVSIAGLTAVALKESDLASAQRMQKAKAKLFAAFRMC